MPQVLVDFLKSLGRENALAVYDYLTANHPVGYSLEAQLLDVLDSDPDSPLYRTSESC